MGETFVFFKPPFRDGLATILPGDSLLPLTNSDGKESRIRRNEAALAIGRSSKSFV